MKKIIVGFVAALAAVVMCFCIAGCSTSVAGHTYTFKDVEIKVEGEVPEGMQEMVDGILAYVKAQAGMEGMSMTFKEDGTATTNMEGMEGEVAYYKQEGNKVYMLDSADEEVTESTQYMTVEGSNLVMSQEMDGSDAGLSGVVLKIKVIFSK